MDQGVENDLISN